jgi:dephospho-CoA kinase
MLSALGAEVIDADLLVHRLMEPGTESWRAILLRFGASIQRPDGTIDRKALGELVFRDPAALADLESILHPGVRKLAEERIAVSDRPVVVLEAIKLVEGSWRDRVDSIWVVTCPREQQIERLMRDRGMSRDEAELRIDAQSPASEKLKHADVIIDNGGTVEGTRRQVEAAWEAISA